MKGEKLELWQQLCAQAAIEQDPQRLMELVREINRLLGEKQDRLNREVYKPNGARPGQENSTTE